jgi:hypothetical protein
MKNVLFEQRNIKLRKKRHFVEGKIDYAASLKNAVNFPVA